MRIHSVAVSLMLMAACASALSQVPLDKITAASADVRVTAFHATVVVRVGQTLGIQPPVQNAEWQVDYDAESLRPVSVKTASWSGEEDSMPQRFGLPRPIPCLLIK